jgi:hypothetical protein
MAKELGNTAQSARYQVKNGSQEERTRTGTVPNDGNEMNRNHEPCYASHLAQCLSWFWFCSTGLLLLIGLVAVRMARSEQLCVFHFANDFIYGNLACEQR